MHPAEKELITSALEQIEASCRSLRRYLSFQARERAASVSSTGEPPAAEGFPAEAEESEDQLERMLAKMMGMPGSGGTDVESTL